MASQEPQTAPNESKSKSEYAFTQNTVLRILDREILNAGLRMQGRFFSEDNKMFGSLDIRGGYVIHDMCTLRKEISSSSPKDILNLKQCLADKALRFWKIPGAKEEQMFVEAYENMVKITQGIPAEEAENYSAYMEHRLRLATSTYRGEILGLILRGVFSNEGRNLEMRFAAYQAAKALQLRKYDSIDANDDMNVDYSRSEERKNSKEVTAKSLDGRSFALLVNNSLGKRKRLSGDEDDNEMVIVKNSSDGNVITAAAGTSAAHSKPLEDETFKSQSIAEENIAARAMRADTRSTIKLPPIQKKKEIYSWMTPEKIKNDTETPKEVGTKTYDPVGTRISARTPGLGTATFGTRTSGLRTSRLRTFDIGSSATQNSTTRNSNSSIFDSSPKFELSDFATPFTLLSNQNKRRRLTDAENIEGQDEEFILDISGPD